MVPWEVFLGGLVLAFVAGWGIAVGAARAAAEEDAQLVRRAREAGL